MLPDAVFTVLFLAAAATDCRRRVIPDWLTIGGTGLALALHRLGWGESCLGLAAGAASGLLLRWAGGRLLRGRIKEAARADPEVDAAFGMGDVKLMGLVGAELGWRGVAFVYLASAAAGALAGALSGRRVLPFAPFVAGAAILRIMG